MVILPAIDLQGGMVVRLSQGDFDSAHTYSDDPKSVAADFISSGARYLHVVDLDGARLGDTVNFEIIREIASLDGLFIEVGGGIRDEKRIASYLELGVGRVILGTIAVEDFRFTSEMIIKYGDKIAVGVDVRDGMAATRGWLNTTGTGGMELCKRLCGAGVSTIIYTDISRDGMMLGINLDAYRELQKSVSCDVIASGGISTLDELVVLSEMGIHGAILGKSIYSGAINLEEAIAKC